MVLVWGSTKGVVLDAWQALPERRKNKIKVVQMQYLWPFPTEYMREILRKTKQILLIENNSNAQLGQLIAQETGVLLKNKLLKYDGRPFFREEVLSALNKL